MIPRRLHYVWVGGKMPDQYQAFIEGWRRLHPDWEVVGWNESNIDFSHPLIGDAYRRRQWAKVADIVRLMAVHAQGGIYLDTDFEVLKPLDGLLDEHCFLAFQGSEHASDLVVNGVFGAVPGHWFIGEALRTMLAMQPIPFGFERPTRYGPKLITRVLRRYGLDREYEEGLRIRDILIHPAPVFFPYPFHGTFTPDCVREETLAIHHWGRSWDSTVPRPLRVAREAKRHLDRLVRPPPPSWCGTTRRATAQAAIPASPPPAALRVIGADPASPLIGRLRAALGDNVPVEAWAAVSATPRDGERDGPWRRAISGTPLDWLAPGGKGQSQAGPVGEPGAVPDAATTVLLDPHGIAATVGQRIWRVVDAAGRPLLGAFFARDLCYNPSNLASLFLVETCDGGTSWMKLGEAHPAARQPYPTLLRMIGEAAVTMIAAVLHASGEAPAKRLAWAPAPRHAAAARGLAALQGSWQGGPLRWRLAHARRRLRDALTVEDWAIGMAKPPPGWPERGGQIAQARWLRVPRAEGFVADPLPWPGRPGVVLCERFDHRTGLGRLQALPIEGDWSAEAEELPIPGEGHLSYPFAWEEDGRSFCLPEMASRRRQAIYELRPGSLPVEVATVAEGVAMADATLFRHGGLLWIAYTDMHLGAHDNLCLMHAERLEGPWTPHRGNPVKVDVRSSRPAGAVFSAGGGLLRPAQDCSRGYGGAVVLNRILVCDPGEYREEAAATLWPDPLGPFPDGLHTFSLVGDLMLIDGKRVVFDPAIVLHRARRRLLRGASGGAAKLRPAAAGMTTSLSPGVAPAPHGGEAAT